MTMTIHLGVFDIPYADASYTPLSPKQAQKAWLGSPKTGKVREKKRLTNSAPAKPASGSGGFKTTGDIAEILEDRYHIMETFFELHEDKIMDSIAESIENAIASIHAGAPGHIDPHLEGLSELETEFKQFLSNRGMDSTGTSGVPTKAALRGVSHRFLHPYAKRPSRPSFIDTGLYQANFHAWVSE